MLHGHIDASRLQLSRNIGEMYAFAQRGEEIPIKRRTHTRRTR
ncbi:hypothetical protein RCO28_26665 [Streptomyces sp. LHD-70]|nr:hypothetical protein [Streptomyces sp. LHD-70]MDQ8706033.1 hypothetical protein [Streptomyces sp. LHD-70]